MNSPLNAPTADEIRDSNHDNVFVVRFNQDTTRYVQIGPDVLNDQLCNLFEYVIDNSNNSPLSKNGTVTLRKVDVPGPRNLVDEFNADADDDEVNIATVNMVTPSPSTRSLKRGIERISDP